MCVLNEKNTEIIIAGPGVGKTTELLNRVEKALLEGVPPLEIAFFSFSNTAVNEGLSRITKRMKYSRNQFRYFKTLHSMAFSLLGLDSQQIISYQLMNQFAKENDLKLSAIDYRTGTTRYQTADSLLLSQLDSARLLGMSVREYFIKNHIEKPTIAAAEELNTKYLKFKMAHGAIDFTDMILLANQTEIDTPHFQYMFIDEAQDLSTQQWKFVEKLALNTDNIVIVGDERQAIAEYAGADVDYFLNLKGRFTELNRSHRIPRKVWKLARKVESHMIKTRGAAWFPRNKDFGETDEGEVIRITELPVRDMARGSWLILTRTNQQLLEFKQYMMKYCQVMPTFFSVDNQAPVDCDVFKAIKIFEALSLTKDKMTKYDFIVPDKDDTADRAKKKKTYVLLLKKFMTSRNYKTADLDEMFMRRLKYKSWYDAFDKLTIPDKQYIKSIKNAYDKHPDGFAKANIKLSTIHSSKGMEADNVVLYTCLTEKTYQDWQTYKETNDSEVKVLFVGVTRARKKLYLLHANTRISKYSYKELLG